MVGAMTFHTKRWLESDFMFKRMEVKSPQDIKIYIWNKFKDSFKSENDKNNFIKGISMCDFNALYDYKTRLK